MCVECYQFFLTLMESYVFWEKILIHRCRKITSLKEIFQSEFCLKYHTKEKETFKHIIQNNGIISILHIRIHKSNKLGNKQLLNNYSNAQS